MRLKPKNKTGYATRVDSRLLGFTPRAALRKETMRVAVNIRNKPVDQQVTFGRQVYAAMVKNPSLPDNVDLLSNLEGRTDALAQTHSALLAARQSVRELTLQLESQVQVWLQVVTQVAGGVQEQSEGDGAKIVSAGFQAKNGSTPIGPLHPPVNLEAVTNGHAGQVRLRWNPVRGADSYEVQISSADPDLEANWKHRAVAAASRITLDGLTSVSRCWFRVRGVGAFGPSGLSDPAVKIP